MVAGLCISFSANHSCSFITLKIFTSEFDTVDDGVGSVIEFTNTTTFTTQQYGIWRGISPAGTCRTYSDQQEVDSMWKISRFCSTASDLIGACAVLFMVLSRLIKIISSKFIILLSLLSAFFQGCTLVFLSGNACASNQSLGQVQGNALNVDGECWFAYGAKSTIVGMTVWLMSGLLLMLRPEWHEKDNQTRHSQSVHHMSEASYDGTNSAKGVEV